MPSLVCRDLETTLDSLAGAIGVSVDHLSQVLHHYDETRLEGSSVDPYVQMPREVLEEFGTEGAHFDGAQYFHGTRVCDPEALRRHGILPLEQMVDRIWRSLYTLVRNRLSEEEWHEFRCSIENGAGGHDGDLYRMKTLGELDQGPHGLLVREIFIDPGAVSAHDYLDCPEIVQDIARCLSSAKDIDLEERFRSASRPCIVTFRSTSVSADALPTAIWYAFWKLRHAELTMNALGGFDGEGKPVPSQDIVDVEVLSN